MASNNRTTTVSFGRGLSQIRVNRYVESTPGERTSMPVLGRGRALGIFPPPTQFMNSVLNSALSSESTSVVVTTTMVPAREDRGTQVEPESKEQEIQTVEKRVAHWSTQTFHDDWKGVRGRAVRFVTPREYVPVCTHQRETGSFFIRHPRIASPIRMTHEDLLAFATRRQNRPAPREYYN